ncbi:Ig-like domain-containing protein [Microbacterium sp. A588]
MSAVTAAVVAIGTLAFVYDGNPTTKVDLNDGGVWITKTSSLLVGHFNHESTVLDGGLRNSGEQFDILQDEETVLVVDSGDSALTSVDPARVSLGDSTTLPADAKVALGHDTAAILDQKSGDLWVVPVAGIAGLEIRGSEPLVELGPNADVAVAQDGTVFGLSGERGEVVTVPVDNEGAPLEPTVESVGEIGTSVTPSITAVGSTPVVLDAAEGAVMTPGGFRTEIERADGAVLQMASAQTDAVAIATTSELLSVPLDGSELQRTSTGAQGAPAVPVSLRGCVYGAWAASGKFIRECPGDGSDVLADIPEGTESASLTFRVNRDVIVLNDAIGGAAWLADESLQRIDNWSDLTPPEGDTEEDEESTEETVETTLPERTEINTVPVAEDDSYGVRPGGTALLPVLDNDNDSDGDVLVASLIQDQPSIGTVQQIQNGGALQIAVAENASGSASFAYEVDDGRGGKDTATVTLSVHDSTKNGAPKPKRQTTLAVESGGTLSYNILPDWIDPDGDDIYLKDVVPAEGDEVDFTTDGQITYRAVASPQGRKEIQVIVADGQQKTATSTIILDVRPPGSTDPKTNADHVVTRIGEQVTVAPLANDTSTSREPLRLARVLEVPGTTILPDFDNKTFTFSADKTGVYYVQYLVTAGAKGGKGLVRIDVVDAEETDLPPVAVRDVALLPTGGDALIGVLNNDSDPAGGILVVQSVSVEPSSGISVSVLNHEMLRITDQGTLQDQVRVTYRISNGSKTAEGEVIVIPIPAPEEILAPVANDDSVQVRAGDVVTIPVLDNDTHPSDDAMHVSPDLIDPLIDPEDGEAFVSQDTVRFRAGDEPKTVYATYEVVDSHQNKAAGYITIQILPVDVETNAAPRPRDVVARTLSGSTVHIPIPLHGIDEDGDSVELMGPATNPTKGRIVDVAADYITYEALDTSTGADTFTYRVRDRLGKEGVATIRVGIAPPEQMNQAPFAVKDAVVVRPGREVAVPVTENDSDPEGDQVALVEDGLQLPDIEGLSARVSGDRVLVQVPDRPLETSLQYTIQDSRGATASAVLSITVNEDVPLLPPIAADDRVQLTDLEEDQLTADLDVLANDEDPDGTVEELELAVGAGATLLDDGKVRVTVGETLQLIRYTITDRDDLQTSAFIFVPASKDLRPDLNPAVEPIEVVSGETKIVPLADYVTVAGGGRVMITEHAKVSAIHSNGADLVQDAHTLVYTSAERYFGQDVLMFEVTDGTSVDDPNGRKATLSIPVTVLPPANEPPTFTGATVTVAPGEEAVTVDLAALTTDPDEDDTHDYTLVRNPGDGVSASIEGSILSVEASTDADKGTALTLPLRITDGETDPIEGSVSVTVSASTRPMPAANTDTFTRADQGEMISVPVLENDFNPFPETPLKVVRIERESGEGAIAIKDDRVEVTPDANFVGTMVVSYRIQDATKDPDREADGQIVLTVQGVPDAPGIPVVTSVQDRTVVLSYSAPSNNGAEIDHYTVKSVTGSPYTKECTSTTCTLSGLTNNVEYAFEVTATNRVGESEPSQSSEIARPDARPDTPNPPTLVFGDRSLKVAWKTPTTPGSPVDSFTLEISPAPPSGIVQKVVTGNSVVWEGLENGADYEVKVRAHNQAPEPSSWSGWSASVIPAGPPMKPAQPTTAELTSVGNQAQMQINWVAPANNGDGIDGYQLEIRRGSTVVRTHDVAAGTTSFAATVDTSESGYTYRIRAQNKAGWGEWSDPSVERRGVIAPGAPTAVTAAPGDKFIDVAFTPGPRNGARADEIVYEYRLNSGAWQRNWDGTRIGGLTNGTTYAVQVRGVATVGGSTYAGAASGSASAVPYGTPFAPTADAVGHAQKVTLSWNANGSGNGRPIQVDISINGGAWQLNVGKTGTRDAGNDYDQTHDITVRVTDSLGNVAPIASAVANTAPKPPPPPPPAEVLTAGKGDPVNRAECSTYSCAYVTLTTKNFRSSGNYALYCDDGGRPRFGGMTKNVPANGTVQLSCFYGNPGNTIRVYIQELDRYSEPFTWR